MKEFIINKYISLKLEGDRTNVYVNGDIFSQCKGIFLTEPHLEIFSSQIKSIDDFVDISNKMTDLKDLRITPEELFWGHCSNLQAWYEHDYDTRLLHSYLSFPLLEKLHFLGVPSASVIFQEEICRRFTNGSLSTACFLLIENFLNYLGEEQIQDLLLINNEELRIKLISSFDNYPLDLTVINILENLIRKYNDTEAKVVLKEGIRHIYNKGNDTLENSIALDKCVDNNLFDYFNDDELISLVFYSKSPICEMFLTLLKETKINSKDLVLKLKTVFKKDRETAQSLIEKIILALDPAESNEDLFDFILRQTKKIFE